MLEVSDVLSSSSWSGSRGVTGSLGCGSGVDVTVGSMPVPGATRVVTMEGGPLEGVGAKFSEHRVSASRW